MSKCDKAARWASAYQWAARILVFLGIFETKFGEKVLDYLDSKVERLCCNDCEKCERDEK